MKNVLLVKKSEVLARCALSNSTLYRLIKNGSFPEPVKVTGCRAVAWRTDELDAWIEGLDRAVLANYKSCKSN